MFSFPFTLPFYRGAGGSQDTPGRYDIALNGRGYMLDDKAAAFAQAAQTIPLIRPQADVSEEPGEASSNPEDLWPRSQASWHLGAGQEYLDAQDSLRTRFWRSLGVDPWQRGRLSLLPDTALARATVNSNAQLLRVGDYAYLVDGNQVYFSQAPFSTWTTANIHAGETAQTVRSFCSDGARVYAALGSNGVHTSLAGTGSSTSFNDLDADIVDYVKGRLMAAKNNVLYNITAGGAAPAPLYTHSNADFRWVAFAEGTAVLFMAGRSGDRSTIYKSTVKEDGTALDIPTVAGSLPDGERIQALQAGLGYLAIGTSVGWRLATEDQNGNLTIGSLVRTGSPCMAFEFQDRFVWFGWPFHDSAHSGLGRMDLANFSAPGVPAYASDLMTGTDVSPVQAQVTSIITGPNDRRMFVVAGVGVYVEADTLVSTGWLESGQISFGVTNDKIALRAAVKHRPLGVDEKVEMFVSADGGNYVASGVSNTVGSSNPPDPMRVPEMTGQLYQVKLQLTGSNPILERYDFRSYPASRRGLVIQVPILLHELVRTAGGAEEFIDVRKERALIESYVGQSKLVSFQELASHYSVFVDAVTFARHSPTRARDTYNGTLTVSLKVLGD